MYNWNKMRDFYILWATQSLSQLGSAVIGFALTLWLYEKTGSALSTAALTICTYAPYVAMSIFAGALTDKYDRKKTMLVCDALAALSTIVVFVLYRNDCLQVRHLYMINVLSGLMNTVQQPASEVAYTRIIPKEYYQKTGGLQSLSRSLVSIGSPVIAAALYGLAGLTGAVAADLITFAIAFTSLLFFVRIPADHEEQREKNSVFQLAAEGLAYLRENKLILNVILFMSGVNLISSAFNAALPALIIPSPAGGNSVLGIVSSCSGIAMVFGSVIASVMPKPKNRVRIIYLSMLFSLGTENFILALTRSPAAWCIAQILGWIFIPVMSTNQNVIMRNTVPVNLQGRIFACRNTLQFFTIPVGLLAGGYLVDSVCEPFMRGRNDIFTILFGSGKGSGASMMLFILGVLGTMHCIVFGRRLRRYHYSDN